MNPEIKMPDFYDEIKFLNSDWGMPNVYGIGAQKWTSVEEDIEETVNSYIRTVIAKLRVPEFKGAFQVTAVTTITQGVCGAETAYDEDFTWEFDER